MKKITKYYPRNCRLSLFLVALPLASQLILISSYASLEKQKWALSLGQGTGSGIVDFEAIGRPSALRVHGRGSDLKGNLTVDKGKASGTFIFELNSLRTGIQKRDEHMKQKYLETDKYPRATLILKDIAVPESIRSADGTPESVPLQGMISLHGVEKSVTGAAKVQKLGNLLDIEATLNLKVTDYLNTLPTFAGITIANDVSILVKISASIRQVN